MKLFVIVKKAVQQAITGAANFVVHVRPALMLRAVARIVAARTNAGIALVSRVSNAVAARVSPALRIGPTKLVARTLLRPAPSLRAALSGIGARSAPAVSVARSPATLRGRLLPALSVLRGFVTGTAGAQPKPAVAMSNRNLGTARAPQVPAFDVPQTFVTLQRTAGASSWVEEPVAGRSDWATEVNATGKANGATATCTGNALGARGGVLVLSYPAHVNKTALTITKVELHFHIAQTDTFLNNGTFAWGYRISGGGNVPLGNNVANFDALVTPLVYDLTGVVAGDWSKLDTIKTYLSHNSPLGAAAVSRADAVHLYVEANRTETQ